MSPGRSIEASREEILTLFRTWATDGAVIRVEFSFMAFALALRVRAKSVNGVSVHLMSDDKQSELTLPLPTGATFRFLDLADFPGEDRFERMFLMFFPYDGDPGDSDHISFAEYKEPTRG